MAWVLHVTQMLYFCMCPPALHVLLLLILTYIFHRESIKVWRNIRRFRGEYSQFEEDCGGTG